MKKYLTLNYATWRSGGDTRLHSCLIPANVLGTGQTALLNDEGYMCCLGQFSAQQGIKKKLLLNVTSPAYIRVPYLIKNFLLDNGVNSMFSINAMEINDDNKTTPEEKIKLLKVLCKEEGFILRVINKPK